MKLYGIFDKASNMYVDRVMVLPADAAAIRVFDEACRDQRSEIAKYPLDFELVRLGEFNNETGEISSECHLIRSGKDVMNG